MHIEVVRVSTSGEQNSVVNMHQHTMPVVAALRARPNRYPSDRNAWATNGRGNLAHFEGQGCVRRAVEWARDSVEATKPKVDYCEMCGEVVIDDRYGNGPWYCCEGPCEHEADGPPPVLCYWCSWADMWENDYMG